MELILIRLGIVAQNQLGFFRVEALGEGIAGVLFGEGADYQNLLLVISIEYM